MLLSGEARVRVEVLEAAQLTEVDNGEEEDEAPQHGGHLHRPAPAPSQQPRLGQHLSEDDIQDHPGRQPLHHLHWL